MHLGRRGGWKREKDEAEIRNTPAGKPHLVPLWLKGSDCESAWCVWPEGGHTQAGMDLLFVSASLWFTCIFPPVLQSEYMFVAIQQGLCSSLFVSAGGLLGMCTCLVYFHIFILSDLEWLLSSQHLSSHTSPKIVYYPPHCFLSDCFKVKQSLPDIFLSIYFFMVYST